MNWQLYLEEFQKPCPCDNCVSRSVCKAELKACRQFLHYVNNGRVAYSFSKEPTRKIWQQIFITEETEKEEE